MSQNRAARDTGPLSSIDATPLHAAVTSLAAALHDYVDVAAGVRTEFSAAEADDDPRMLALENRIGHLNAELFDALHDALGMHPNLTTSVWVPEGSGAATLPAGIQRTEVHYLGFLVAAPPRNADMTLEGVIDLLDSAGQDVTEQLANAGYEVIEWASARGEAPGFGEEE
ncbi:MAG: hypothetical protein FWD83_04920 [Promicromonosporaceae bacterium]|nr:hypothetical protein [Promicromonosporaceae bacterium]